MNSIIICGFMGAGKTVVGRELAKLMGCRFVDTDALIEQKQGIPVKAIFAAYGEDYFRDLEYEMCRKAAAYKGCVISTGGGTLTFDRNVQALKRDRNKIVFLDASFDAICDRIGENANRPLFQDREAAKALYDARRSCYEAVADYVVDGDMSARKTALTIAAIFK